MDGEIIDIEHSEARGGFLKSLKKTYSRRSDRNAPKTTKDKLKRVGGLIPLVALAKAGGMGKNNTRGSVSRRRPVSQEKIEGRPKIKEGQRAMQKRKLKRKAKRNMRSEPSSVLDAKEYFRNK
tara:strand:- start:3758 stop:4126 length:369 start_codon:yes stop_codon:yes gene_type:complete